MRCSSPSLSWTGIWIVSLARFFAGRLVEGHLYLMEPISRNFYYTSAFQTYSFPGITYCPHCLQSRGVGAVRARAEANTPADVLSAYGDGSWPLKVVYDLGELASNGNYLEPEDIAVRHGVCGDPEQTAAEGQNTFGQENSVYPVLETYQAGAVIEMKIVVSTYHWGHLEFFICNSEDLSGDGEDSKVTQGCFNMNPLTRAEDDGEASPIDPNHPGRYYLDPPCRAEETDQTLLDGAFPGYVVTSRYQLPEGLTCERCIVQMIYYTGNACHHPGYEEFSPPSWPGCAPTKGDWITLDPGMCGVGDSYPEEFWNCADIAISSGPVTDDDDVAPVTPEPTPAPTGGPGGNTPSPASTVEPNTPSPTKSPESGTPSPASTVEPNTPSPTKSPESGTPSPASTVEPNTPSPTKSPESGTPSPTSAPGVDTPSPTSTVVPATPSPTRMPESEPTLAPNMSTITSSDDACSDPVAAWQQCGGHSWTGSTCCRAGYQCDELALSYSQCRPVEDDCSRVWEQCGGKEWDGPVCCSSGATCTTRNMWYSQCTP